MKLFFTLRSISHDFIFVWLTARSGLFSPPQQLSRDLVNHTHCGPIFEPARTGKLPTTMLHYTLILFCECALGNIDITFCFLNYGISALSFLHPRLSRIQILGAMAGKTNGKAWTLISSFSNPLTSSRRR